MYIYVANSRACDTAAVNDALAAGLSLAGPLAALPIDRFRRLPEAVRETALGRFRAGLHRLNVQPAYKAAQSS